MVYMGLDIHRNMLFYILYLYSVVKRKSNRFYLIKMG